MFCLLSSKLLGRVLDRRSLFKLFMLNPRSLGVISTVRFDKRLLDIFIMMKFKNFSETFYSKK